MSNPLTKIVLRLAVAGIIKKAVVESWADFLHNQGHTPGIVSISVEKAINGGKDYFNLGHLSAICREESKRVEVDRDIQAERKEANDDKFQDSDHVATYAKMVSEAMKNENPIDVRKALLRANEYGRQNTSGADKEWDQADKQLREELAELAGI